MKLSVDRMERKLLSIKSRCNYKTNPNYRFYGAKGIKCQLTLNDLIVLWKRDRAGWMKRPSIDRIDNAGNYSFKNCRFLEADENRRIRNVFECYRDGLIGKRLYRKLIKAKKYQRMTDRKTLTKKK